VVKNIKKLSFLLALCFFSSAVPLVQAQDLDEYVAIDSLNVGDTFNYSLTLERDQQYDKINFPDSSHFGSTFEIRSRKQFKVSSFKDSVAYQLQFFGTADTNIPQLPVYLIQGQDTTMLYTNPVPVNFSSVLAKDDETFRPLKPIFDFARAWWPYVLGVIILAIAGYYLYQYYLKKQQEEPEEPATFTPVPFVNPLKEYQKAIRKLENLQLESQEDFKTFYIDLGDAIRQYYESLYNLPALESTSRELLIMLQNGGIDENLIKDTRAVLQEADMVKFAKFKPTNKQAERALRKAHNFLERAREIDGPRIEHLRRKHQSRMEAKKRRFNEEQEQKAEKVNA
jgi:hypothetical protein